MKETYKIEKLEDMPKYIPIIFIKDNGMKNSKPRMVGIDTHDRLVIEPNGNHLYYYNLQCGESSHECSDFRFIKREAVCFDDEFYSHFCQKVDLEKLIADYTKQVRKEVCEEIRKQIKNEYITFDSEDDRKAFNKILKQIQG